MLHRLEQNAMKTATASFTVDIAYRSGKRWSANRIIRLYLNPYEWHTTNISETVTSLTNTGFGSTNSNYGRPKLTPFTRTPLLE